MSICDELRVFAQGAVPGLAEGGDNDVPEPGNEFRVGAHPFDLL